MKKDIHPKAYRPVLFVDDSSGAKFIILSTVNSSETMNFEGKEYPVCHVEISSASHPFYTGAEKSIDRTGRAEQFKARARQAAARKEK